MELDIQLTRDGVPVVYHNWTERGHYIHNMTSKECRERPDMLLPSLAETCQALTPDVGMLVEVKYPPPNVQARDAIPYASLNSIVDRTLKVLMAEAAASNSARSIALLSFDADICTMMQLKQAVFPVYMLHCEERDGLECDDADPRTVCVERGIAFAESQHFAGMILFAELVMENELLARRVTSSGLHLMTYSALNANPEVAFRQLHDLGVEGIITDDVIRVADIVQQRLQADRAGETAGAAVSLS